MLPAVDGLHVTVVRRPWRRDESSAEKSSRSDDCSFLAVARSAQQPPRHVGGTNPHHLSPPPSDPPLANGITVLPDWLRYNQASFDALIYSRIQLF